MAIVLKRPGAEPLNFGTGPPVQETALTGLSLPTVKSKPIEDLSQYTWLVYGDPGVGKTSLVGEMDNTFCMMGEPGGKALALYQRDANTWPLVKAYVSLLEGPQGKAFKTVMLDGIELMYKTCFAWKCQQLAIVHPNDANDFGKSWNAIYDEFAGVINRLIALRKGLWFIAHAHVTQHTDRSGVEYTKLKPNLTKGCWDIMEPLVDMVAFYGKFAGDNRQLVIRGDDYTEAKCRPKRNFLTMKGERIRSIDMGDSPEEGMRNVKLAFANKLADSGLIPIIKQKEIKIKRRAA